MGLLSKPKPTLNTSIRNSCAITGNNVKGWLGADHPSGGTGQHALQLIVDHGTVIGNVFANRADAASDATVIAQGTSSFTFIGNTTRNPSATPAYFNDSTVGGQREYANTNTATPGNKADLELNS